MYVLCGRSEVLRVSPGAWWWGLTARDRKPTVLIHGRRFDRQGTAEVARLRVACVSDLSKNTGVLFHHLPAKHFRGLACDRWSDGRDS